MEVEKEKWHTKPKIFLDKKKWLKSEQKYKPKYWKYHETNGWLIEKKIKLAKFSQLIKNKKKIRSELKEKLQPTPQGIQ